MSNATNLNIRPGQRRTMGGSLVNSLLTSRGGVGPGGTVPIQNNNNNATSSSGPVAVGVPSMSTSQPVSGVVSPQKPAHKKKPSTAQPRPKEYVKAREYGPIIEVNDHDVLCGRGGKINAHAGNVQFREMVGLRKKEYLDENTKKLEKGFIAADIVYQIRGRGGRFLKEDAQDGTWWDIGDKKAFKKTGQAFRDDDDNESDDDNNNNDSNNNKVTAPVVRSQSPKVGGINNNSPKTNKLNNKVISTMADVKMGTTTTTAAVTANINEVTMKPIPVMSQASPSSNEWSQPPPQPKQPAPVTNTRLSPIAQVQLPYSQTMMNNHDGYHHPGMMNPPLSHDHFIDGTTGMPIISDPAAAAVAATMGAPQPMGGSNRYFKGIVPRFKMPSSQRGGAPGISGAAQQAMMDTADIFGKNFHPPAELEIAGSMISGVSSTLTDQMSCLSFTGSEVTMGMFRGVGIGSGGEQQPQQQSDKFFAPPQGMTTTNPMPNEANVNESFAMDNAKTITATGSNKDLRLSSITMSPGYFDDSWTNGPLMNHSLISGITRDDSFLYGSSTTQKRAPTFATNDFPPASSSYQLQQQQQPGYNYQQNVNTLHQQQQQHQQLYYIPEQSQYDTNEHHYHRQQQIQQQQQQQPQQHRHDGHDWLETHSLASGISVSMKEIGDDFTITSDVDRDQVPMMNASARMMKGSNRSNVGNSLTSSGVAGFVNRAMATSYGGMDHPHYGSTRSGQQYVGSGMSIASLSINEGDNISVADSMISALSDNLGALDLASFSEASYYRAHRHASTQPYNNNHYLHPQQHHVQYFHNHQPPNEQQQQHQMNNRMVMNHPPHGDEFYGNMNSADPSTSQPDNSNDNDMKPSISAYTKNNPVENVNGNNDANSNVTKFALYEGREMLEV